MIKSLFLFFLLFSCFFVNAQSRYIPVSVKKIVYTRDRGACQCCGSSQDLEYDHVTPYSCGGTSTVSNIQLLCFTCNRSKSNSCVCKVHNRKVGTNCCAGKTTKKSSSTSSSTQCTGTTQKGTRCKKRTTSASGRCHLH